MMLSRHAHRFSTSLFVFLALSTALTACVTPAKAPLPPIPVGVITDSIGLPTVIRKNQPYILGAQAKIYESDIIETDKDSSVKIRMIDESTFTLGPNSHFVIHNYQLTQGSNASNARMSFTSGSLRTKSANITQTRRARFEIRTPLATVEVLGRDFWIGYLFGENTLDVVLIDGPGIDIENDSGSVSINQFGFGTTVTGDSAPRMPSAWLQSKIELALSETEF